LSENILQLQTGKAYLQLVYFGTVCK